jgi:hypothetical protein
MIRFLLAVFLLATSAGAEPIRIKDLVEFDGVRGNDLVGYGLVVGLNGTGDGLRNAPFTEEIMANLLERLGANVTGEEFRPKNVAAVFVTAQLPPFARAGGRIDVTVSAIGDAKSLLGGTLVMTPLNGADGQIYAVAQGTIIAGGVAAEGQGAKVTQGVPTAGVIPSGARVEREVEFDFAGLPVLRLALKAADFTTAARIEQAVNAEFGARVAERFAKAQCLFGRCDRLAASAEPFECQRSIPCRVGFATTISDAASDDDVLVIAGNGALRLSRCAKGEAQVAKRSAFGALIAELLRDGQILLERRDGLRWLRDIQIGDAQVGQHGTLGATILQRTRQGQTGLKIANGAGRLALLDANKAQAR